MRADRQNPEGGANADPGALLALARFVFETGYLKRVPRTGWFLAGVESPESVAEHTSRTTMIGMILALLSEEPVEPGRVAMMCALHDLAETRTGDIPSVGKQYLVKTGDVDVLHDQLAGAPDAVESALVQLIEEYEDRKTIEARLARDADKLECLAQAIEYQRAGIEDASQWITGSYESIGTEVGRSLADAVLNTSPGTWWHDFVSSYRTPPA